MLLTTIPSDVLKNNLVRHIGRKHIMPFMEVDPLILELASNYGDDRIFWKRSVENEFNKGELLGPDSGKSSYSVDWKYVYEMLYKGGPYQLLSPIEDNTDYIDLAIELGLDMYLSVVDWGLRFDLNRSPDIESLPMYIAASSGNVLILERLMQEMRVALTFKTHATLNINDLLSIKNRGWYINKHGAAKVNNEGYELKITTHNLNVPYILINTAVMNGHLNILKFLLMCADTPKRGYTLRYSMDYLIDLSLAHKQFHVTEELFQRNNITNESPNVNSVLDQHIDFWKYLLNKYTDIKLHWIDIAYYENVKYENSSYSAYSNMIKMLIINNKMVREAECKSLDADCELLTKCLSDSVNEKLPSFTLFNYLIEHEASIINNETILGDAVKLWGLTVFQLVKNQLKEYFKDYNRQEQFYDAIDSSKACDISSVATYLSSQHNIFI